MNYLPVLAIALAGTVAAMPQLSHYLLRPHLRLPKTRPVSKLPPRLFLGKGGASITSVL